jgi:hypothetical protein
MSICRRAEGVSPTMRTARDRFCQGHAHLAAWTNTVSFVSESVHYGSTISRNAEADHSCFEVLAGIVEHCRNDRRSRNFPLRAYCVDANECKASSRAGLRLDKTRTTTNNQSTEDAGSFNELPLKIWVPKLCFCDTFLEPLCAYSGFVCLQISQFQMPPLASARVALRPSKRW